ncbi:hypothetical protein R3P38DRAFT_2762959 [Favolaschia claudopus]|uniref:Uncharacterized protein n=1 Tax=Favolaschia claudopus TaxID=2862362 RepID=A0AAW0DN20_9AGAR
MYTGFSTALNLNGKGEETFKYSSPSAQEDWHEMIGSTSHSPHAASRLTPSALRTLPDFAASVSHVIPISQRRHPGTQRLLRRQHRQSISVAPKLAPNSRLPHASFFNFSTRYPPGRFREESCHQKSEKFREERSKKSEYKLQTAATIPSNYSQGAKSSLYTFIPPPLGKPATVPQPQRKIPATAQRSAPSKPAAASIRSHRKSTQCGQFLACLCPLPPTLRPAAKSNPPPRHHPRRRDTSRNASLPPVTTRQRGRRGLALGNAVSADYSFGCQMRDAVSAGQGLNGTKEIKTHILKSVAAPSTKLHGSAQDGNIELVVLSPFQRDHGTARRRWTGNEASAAHLLLSAAQRLSFIIGDCGSSAVIRCSSYVTFFVSRSTLSLRSSQPKPPVHTNTYRPYPLQRPQPFHWPRPERLHRRVVINSLATPAPIPTNERPPKPGATSSQAMLALYVSSNPTAKAWASGSASGLTHPPRPSFCCIPPPRAPRRHAISDARPLSSKSPSAFYFLPTFPTPTLVCVGAFCRLQDEVEVEIVACQIFRNIRSFFKNSLSDRMSRRWAADVDRVPNEDRSGDVARIDLGQVELFIELHSAMDCIRLLYLLQMTPSNLRDSSTRRSFSSTSPARLPLSFSESAAQCSYDSLLSMLESESHREVSFQVLAFLSAVRFPESLAYSTLSMKQIELVMFCSPPADNPQTDPRWTADERRIAHRPSADGQRTIRR